jgi:hypothetical protein
MVRSIGATNEAGSGYIIRNELGQFVEAGCCKHPQIGDPQISELLACREGREAAARLGISKVILQSDCSNLVKLWNEEHVRAEGAHIFQEMKMVSASFQDYKFLHVGRDANNAAHRSAREALGILVPVRYDVIPGLLTDAVQSDCNHYPS